MGEIQRHLAAHRLADAGDLVEAVVSAGVHALRAALQRHPHQVTRHQAGGEAAQLQACGVRHMATPGADVGADLHGMVLAGAERAEIVLLERTILRLVPVSHLARADDADPIAGLLPPEHLHTDRRAVLQAHVLDLPAAGLDVLLGEDRHWRERRGLDGVIRVDGEQWTQASLAVVPGVSQQEVRSHLRQEVGQIAGVLDLHVAAQAIGDQEIGCRQQRRGVDQGAGQVGAVQ